VRGAAEGLNESTGTQVFNRNLALELECKFCEGVRATSTNLANRNAGAEGR
jgi:hypothetical protein